MGFDEPARDREAEAGAACRARRIGPPEAVEDARTARNLGRVELPLTGGCGCGAVRFEVERPFVSAGYCHCTRCQRRTGSAASATAPSRAPSWSPRARRSSAAGRLRRARRCSAPVADRRSSAASPDRATTRESGSARSTGTSGSGLSPVSSSPTPPAGRRSPTTGSRAITRRVPAIPRAVALRGSRATPCSTTTRPSRSSALDGLIVELDARRGRSATSRSVAARRWRKEPSNRDCFRAARPGTARRAPGRQGAADAAGDAGGQIVAPRSISACAAAPVNTCPVRRPTRSTFTSRGRMSSPNAKLRTAAAVYGPTPSGVVRSSGQPVSDTCRDARWSASARLL